MIYPIPRPIRRFAVIRPGLPLQQWLARQQDKPDILFNASLYKSVRQGIGTLYEGGRLTQNAGSGWGFGNLRGRPGAVAFGTPFDGTAWQDCGAAEEITLPQDARLVRVRAVNAAGEWESSRCYKVLPQAAQGAAARLYCRGMLGDVVLAEPERPVTRLELAWMLLPLADPTLPAPELRDTADAAARCAAANKFFPLQDGCFAPQSTVTRQEMATVAMQTCGVNYRNASSTMPVCTDVAKVANNYGTNAARALYFGFMQLEADGRFDPEREVTRADAVEILNRVADFAGL